jgi:hypothetical protein
MTAKEDKHAEYLRYVEHCLSMAKLAADRDARIIQREMAAEWLRLADILAKDGRV